MKKVFSLMIMLGLFVSLVGCGDKGKQNPTLDAPQGQAGTKGIPPPPPIQLGPPPGTKSPGQ